MKNSVPASSSEKSSAFSSRRQWSCRISNHAEEPDSVERVYWNFHSDNLPFYPFCIEEMTQSKRTWYKENHCQFMIIIIVTEGDIHYQIDGHDYLLVPGQIMIIPQGASYFLQKGSSPFYRKIVAELKGSHLSSLAEQFSLNSFRLITTSRTEHIISLMKEIRQYLGMTDPEVIPHLLGLSYELLGTLSQEIPREASPELFLRAQHLLENNLNRKLTLEEVARETGLTPLGLNQLFQKRMKISPMRYRLECRMAQAKYLLLHTQLLIKEIADRTGYCNPFYFSNEYRKFYGTSPRKTRDEKIL